MKTGLKLVLAILAIFCTISTSRAQRFLTIGVHDGLSDGFVRDIECDSEGYMWFATMNGLNRYDGYNFKKYDLSDFGLNSDVFDIVVEDGAGNLWVKSASNYLFLFDKLTDRLTDDISPALENVGIKDTAVSDIFVDEDKNLWVQTPDKLYIYYYDRERLVSVQLPSHVTMTATTGGHSYAYLGNGELWTVNPECRIIEDAPGRGVNAINGDRNGRLWVLGENVAFYDTGTQRWRTPPGGIIPAGDIAKCMTENGGDIWIGTDRNGIIVLNDRFEKTRKLVSEKTSEFSLASNHINCMLHKNDIIWVGAGQKGVSYSIVNRLDIKRLRNDVPEAVGTIVEDASGNIYVGYDGQGLMRMREDGTMQSILSVNYESILGSYLDDNGDLYFGTYGNGVFIWDGKKTSPVSSDPDFINCTQGGVRYIIKDSAGRLWFGTFNNGLVRLDRDGTIHNYTRDNSALESSSISSMTGPGRDGTIYVSNRHRLYTVSPTTLELVPKETNLRQITQLFLDGRGILWIGTTEGLYYLDRQGEPVHLTTDNGLTDNHIQGICEDRYGNIWVMSEEGFSNLFVAEDPSSGNILVHCHPYFEEDGIGAGHFSRNAIFCSKSGDVLMGNDGDIVAARPEPYAPTNYDTGITVTGISISSVPLPPAELEGRKVLRMKHYDNLSIEVSTLNFHNRRARFEYMVDGGDEWNALSSNVLFFRTLSPGRHTVEIRPFNARQSGISELIQVQVRPPFYKSIVAYVVYSILLLTAAVVLIHMYRTRRKRRLEKEQRRLEEAQLQFFTNISHDLRAPLSMIMAPLEKMKDSEDGRPATKELEQIDRNARILLDEIDQILDFKQMNGSTQTYRPAYGDIARFTAETCKTYADIIQPEDAGLIIDTGSEPIMTEFDRDKLRRILHNLLSNAFKYGVKDGKAAVTVSVRKEDGNAVIRVADNGPGISDKAKSRIFERFFREGGKTKAGNGIGLNIVQEFVGMHGGTVSVSDNKPSGSIFTVSIPITKEMSAKKEAAPAGAEHGSAGRPRILNVEDNPDFRAFVTEKLSALYDVTEASNGLDALERIENGYFDLIVSDVVMPEMDGRALCKVIRADIRHAGTPVILLSGVHGKEAELENLKAGADDTLEKPFDIETLLLRVENILKRRVAGDGPSPAQPWKGSREDRELLERIQKEVEEHLQDNDYSIEALSSALNISRSVLYKRVVALTGKAPIEYIRTIRLQKGKKMIEDGETSISQIAWSVGYTPKQFSRNFKAEYGCLPSEYLHHLKG